MNANLVQVYGVDLGSRTVKIVERNAGGIRIKGIYPTADFYRNYMGLERGELILKKQELDMDERAPIAATGYGRVRLPEKDVHVIPEIKAIALGVSQVVEGGDYLILDMGGQDAKAIMVRDGRTVDFAANDRCAASSGRYLENMAAVLGISLEELTSYHDDPVELSSTCAIFGETELVGLLAEGYPVERLAAGVNLAICLRLLPLVSRFPSELLVCTGGVARNRSLVEFIKEKTGARIFVPENPEYIAARGCCSAFEETHG